MKQEINPQKSNRAEAFRMWMSSPMPMVTLVKTLDISRLVKVSKKSGIKFNVLMCWCIGKAANECKSSCFASDQRSSAFLDEHMVIGTSAMIQTELDCIVNQYTDQFCNPMVMWGKYRKRLFKTTLPVSFQFHHVQIDGGHAAKFFSNLQKEINRI